MLSVPLPAQNNLVDPWCLGGLGAQVILLQRDLSVSASRLIQSEGPASINPVGAHICPHVNIIAVASMPYLLACDLDQL